MRSPRDASVDSLPARRSRELEIHEKTRVECWLDETGRRPYGRGVPYRMYVWVQAEGAYLQTVTGPAFEERAEAVQALKEIREALRVSQAGADREWLNADWLCVRVKQVVAAYFIPENQDWSGSTGGGSPAYPPGYSSPYPPTA